MDDLQALLSVLERLRPELPELVGGEADKVNKDLDSYIAQLNNPNSQSAMVELLIWNYLRNYRDLLRRVKGEMAVAKGLIYHESATRSFDPSDLMASDDDSLSASPAAAGDDPPSPSAPSPVTRYTDITCPRRVWVETPRIVVTVRLTVRQMAESEASAAVTVMENLPILVRIDAPGFGVLEQREQSMTVLPGRDSETLTFYLRPSQIGHTHVVLDFFQAGHPVGTATVEVEVTAHEVAFEQASPKAYPVQSEPGVAMPDRTLAIGYEATAARPQLTFSLFEKGAWREDFQPFPLSQPLERYAAGLYDRLTGLANRATTQPDADQAKEAERLIQSIGFKLWSEVLPDELRRRYLAERATWDERSFLILSDEPHIPWELVWPYATGENPANTQPWCASMNMARWLRRNASGGANPTLTARLKWQRLSCVAPTTANLTFAQQEQTLLKGHMQRFRLHDRSPAHPTTAEVVGVLETGDYDWLHAATHGKFRAGEQGWGSFLSLNDKDILTPDDLYGPLIEYNLRANRPGIVFNTCDSGRQDWGLTGVGGWANRLIGSGASLFLAAQWSVTDKQALTFANQFYKSLGDGDPAAKSVRTARLAARQAGDPTWLAYSLYAHPNAVVGG